MRLNAALAKMNRKGACILMQVRVKADVSGNEGVYPLASIPAPANHARIGPPGMPESIRGEMQQSGWLTLRWTCKHPRGAGGVIYRVHRRTGLTGPFQFLGISGKRKFVDKTVPAGTKIVEYEIRATRSTAEGEAARYHFNFGSTRGSSAPTAVAVVAKGSPQPVTVTIAA